MMAPLGRTLLIAVALFGLAHSASADLVMNGNFEGATYVDPTTGNVLPTGWTLGPPSPASESKVNVSSAVDAANFLGPQSGSNYMRYQSNANVYQGNADCLYQDLVTVTGQSYTVSFWVAITKDSTFGGNSNTGLLAVWDENQTTVDMLSSAYYNPTVAMDYHQFTFTETASSTLTRIDFHGTDTTGSVLVDNVSVSAVVPEPPSLILLVTAGVVGLGVSLRRALRRLKVASGY